MEKESNEGLKRVIGVRSLAANAVNLTVGSGIFTLPAVVAAYLGPASFIAYLLCAILISMVLLCFVESGSKVTLSGGAYVYIERAFGPFVGFLASTLFWFGYCLMADAAVANIVCDNLAVFFPLFKQSVWRYSLMALLFGGIAWLNVLGVKQGATLMEIFTVAKLLPLLLFIVIGSFYVHPENYVVTEWPSWKKIGEVSIILFFAFGGAEASLSASGEIKRPSYTVPRGVLLGALIILLLYVSIHLVAQGILGQNLANYPDAPLATVAQVVMGDAGNALMVLGALLSGFGLISGDILTSSRLPYSSARDGLLPTFLAAVHPKYATPHFSIVFYSGLGFTMAVSGGFRQLAILASAALLCVYVGVVLATIRLRKFKSAENAFLIPGGLLIPVLALLATLWFLSNLSIREIASVVIFLSFFALVFFTMKWIRKPLP